MPGGAQVGPEGVRDEVREQVVLPEAEGGVQRVRRGGAAQGGRPPVRGRAVVHIPGEEVLEWLLWAFVVHIVGFYTY